MTYDIATFHAEALDILDRLGDDADARSQIREKLVRLASQPSVLPDIALDRLHTTGSSATILHEGPDGRGALMLLRLPPATPTPVHNHNSWGIACVVRGRNRYWRWERFDDLTDPDKADLRNVETFDQEAGDSAEWADPPQDWHAQQGIDGDAFEFVFFGQNPLLKPRSYFDPETNAITHAYASDRIE